MSHRMIFLVALFAITAPILIQPFNQDDTDQLSLISEGAHCTEPPDYPIDIPKGGNAIPPFDCAQINFASLAGCCQLHPSIFEYMDPDVRTCTNLTTSLSDFPYFKSMLTDYMINQAVTMKNKLDLRRIPNAVIGDTDDEIFNPTMIDEFIDNVDPSWDDLLNDALTNCSKVILDSVTYPSMTLPMKASQCNDMRAKFRVCDPFQLTSNPPEGDYEKTDSPDDEGPGNNTPPTSDGEDPEYPDENPEGNDDTDGGEDEGDY
ncbi:hypothetical protein B566_EDAN003605 [Ephemera danica]|nr:hypothetical protein B566_EDAN003605 [Ephemera danica]